MSDKDKEKAPKKPGTAIPGFALLCLNIVGVIAGFRGLDEASGELTGVFYLLVSALVFGFILKFYYPNKK